MKSMKPFSAVVVALAATARSIGFGSGVEVLEESSHTKTEPKIKVVNALDTRSVLGTALDSAEGGRVFLDCVQVKRAVARSAQKQPTRFVSAAEWIDKNTRGGDPV